jgi:predicted DNA-binding transcriptional regulator YafY
LFLAPFPPKKDVAFPLPFFHTNTMDDQLNDYVEKLNADRLERVLDIIGILDGREEPITANQIHEIIYAWRDPDGNAAPLDIRSIQRDIRLIGEIIGTPLIGNGHAGFNLPNLGAFYDRIFSLFLSVICGEEVFMDMVQGLLGNMEYPMRVLALLKNGIRARYELTFTYQKEHPGAEPAEYRLRPYDIHYRVGRWYLVGEDVKAGIFKNFLICNMSGMVIHTDGQFTRDTEYRRADFYNNSIGVFSGGEITLVKLRFYHEATAKIKNMYLHLMKSILEENDEYMDVEMEVNNYYEVRSLLTKFLTTSEMLEPAEWRERIRADLDIALGRYSG